MTKYNVRYSREFKKCLKKVTKQGKNIEKLLDLVDKLVYKEPLEAKYRNHKLSNDGYFSDCYECHIEPDWLLVYKYFDDELVLLLVTTGNHSDLF
jgi:mRNA interferase YafQ